MKKNIIILIIVALVLMVAFWYMGNKGTGAGSASLSASQSTSESADAQYIYSLLQQMNRVQQNGQLNDSVFSEPAFLNLKDNTVLFNMPPAGRNNPFAPVGSNSNPAPSTSTIRLNIKK